MNKLQIKNLKKKKTFFVRCVFIYIYIYIEMLFIAKAIDDVLCAVFASGHFEHVRECHKHFFCIIVFNNLQDAKIF